MRGLIRFSDPFPHPDGKPVRQSPRDAGLPEGLPADPGGADCLLA